MKRKRTVQNKFNDNTTQEGLLQIRGIESYRPERYALP